MKIRGLYAITPDAGSSAELLEKVRAALEGRITLLQYRRKKGNAAEAWRIVELDRCATDMLAAIADSYQYLSGLAR